MANLPGPPRSDRADRISSGGSGIRLRGVTKTFGTPTGPVGALGPLDVDIEPGSFVAVVGPSGCGKSTLVRLLCGLERPTTGTVEVLGRHPEELAADGEVGIAFQDPGLLPWRSVAGNVALPLAARPGRRPGRDVDDLLVMVGLGGMGNARPAQLSGGMQQRVSIARALVGDPRLLLLDEPFGALDEILRSRLNGELERIWAELLPTTLLVTHSISEAVVLADRVLVLSGPPGRIVDDVVIDLGRPRTGDDRDRDDVRDRPEYHELVARVRSGLRAGGA